MATFLLIVVLAVGLSAQAPIAVYVEAGDPASPFVDPALKDSAKDLTDDLKGKRVLRVVARPSDARVVIRLLARSRSGIGGAAIVQTAPNVAYALPSNNRAIVAVLIVGDFRHDLTGVAEMVWRAASKDLAKQVERWITENQSKLR